MKTTLKTSLFILILIIGNTISALAGTEETQTRNVRDFNAIDVSAGIDLYVMMGNTEEVKIVADNDIIDDIKTEVRNGTLHIYMKQNKWFNWGGTKTRKAYVSVKELVELHASAGSDVKSENMLEGETLEISASSGSDIELTVRYKNLSLDTSSGSDAELSGKVKFLKLSASSGSDIDASDLEAVNCRASASSGSEISLTVTDELDADASSGADISYNGNPKAKNINESSGGDVRGR